MAQAPSNLHFAPDRRIISPNNHPERGLTLWIDCKSYRATSPTVRPTQLSTQLTLRCWAAAESTAQSIARLGLNCLRNAARCMAARLVRQRQPKATFCLAAMDTHTRPDLARRYMRRSRQAGRVLSQFPHHRIRTWLQNGCLPVDQYRCLALSAAAGSAYRGKHHPRLSACTR